VSYVETFTTPLCTVHPFGGWLQHTDAGIQPYADIDADAHQDADPLPNAHAHTHEHPDRHADIYLGLAPAR
jgi:hypothetical protein